MTDKSVYDYLIEILPSALIILGWVRATKIWKSQQRYNRLVDIYSTATTALWEMILLAKEQQLDNGTYDAMSSAIVPIEIWTKKEIFDKVNILLEKILFFSSNSSAETHESVLEQYDGVINAFRKDLGLEEIIIDAKILR